MGIKEEIRYRSPLLLQSREKMATNHCEERDPEVGVHLGGQIERRAETISRVSARNHPLNKKPSGCRFSDKCACMHQQVEGQPRKKPRKSGDNSTVSTLKKSRHLDCVSQDTEPPKSSSILRKGTKVLRPTRSVKFSMNALRHINIRESKGPSLGVIQLTSPHVRSPYRWVSGRNRNVRAMRPRRCVDDGQTYSKAQGKGQSYLLLTYLCLVSFSALLNESRRKRVCGGFQSANAHAEQE